MKPAVKIKNLVKSFESEGLRTEVLKNIDLEARPGEMLMIVGPSGCGKTTLLSCIAGVLHIDQGEIEIFGTPLTQISEDERIQFRGKNIGFIFQQFNLISTLDISENVSVPLLLSGMEENKALQQARDALEKVGLKDHLHKPPAKLSGGQQQRVAIARALVHKPKLIICDEPTSSLDGKTGHTVVGLLREISKDQDRSVIVVTHDHRIFEFADRIVEMEDGRIKKIYQHPQEFHTLSL